MQIITHENNGLQKKIWNTNNESHDEHDEEYTKEEKKIHLNSSLTCRCLSAFLEAAVVFRLSLSQPKEKRA